MRRPKPSAARLPAAQLAPPAAGNKPHLAFEGGQTPLRRRLPKRGFVNTCAPSLAADLLRALSRASAASSSLRLSPLNLDTLTSSILSGKLDTSRVLNMKDLRDAGAVGKIRNGVKLLGRGAAGFAASGLQGVQIEVSRASATARAAVEAAGGRLTTVHYNALGMRALLKPHKFLLVPRPAQPAPRMRDRVDAVGGCVPTMARATALADSARCRLPAGAPPSPVPPALTRRGALLPTGA